MKCTVAYKHGGRRGAIYSGLSQIESLCQTALPALRTSSSGKYGLVDHSLIFCIFLHKYLRRIEDFKCLQH